MDSKAKAVERARELIEDGLSFAAQGDVRRARDTFRDSFDLQETAKALTCWAAIEHRLGDTPQAISLCEQAIDLDPEFGNSYNDIGAYLVSQSKLDEAIHWFERATEADRFDSRQNPYINLGRIYMGKRLYLKALQHFEEALRHAPDEPELTTVVDALKESLT